MFLLKIEIKNGKENSLRLGGKVMEVEWNLHEPCKMMKNLQKDFQLNVKNLHNLWEILLMLLGMIFCFLKVVNE